MHLRPQELGELRFGVSYLPTAQRLTFNIAGASNLKYEEVTPELDSFSEFQSFDSSEICQRETRKTFAFSSVRARAAAGPDGARGQEEEDGGAARHPRAAVQRDAQL